MKIRWKQQFNIFKKKGEDEVLSKIDVTIEIEGPERFAFTNIPAIMKDVTFLENRLAEEILGHSTIEALTIFLKNVIQKNLFGTSDKLAFLKVIQDDFFECTIEPENKSYENELYQSQLNRGSVR
ncbi:MAG: hypothetical protein HQM10_22955 [Candidatus Riflebacteria bacterium]|nr:hypothetical protein [Candidatus Riflebacteria bacterium]